MEGLPSTSRQQMGWVPRGPERPNCPPGLENLIPLDFFWVQQEREALEMTYSVETENRYYVKNHSGLNLFYAMEKSTYCARNCSCCCCCCKCRPFEMRVSDYSGGEVIHLSRPCVCCYDEIHVFSPPAVSIGTVAQGFGFCRPSFTVTNAEGDRYFNIKGPCCLRSCCCFASCCGRDVDFKVVGVNGDVVGKISKQWAGYNTESDADIFGISFPVNLEVRMKAVMLGACILIDMMYFEEDPKKRKMRNQTMPR